VLYWAPDGSLVAENTDGDGFLAALDEAAPGWRDRENRALIVGAGGAAQGIMAPLMCCAGPMTLINRTRSRAEALVAKLRGNKVRDWSELSEAFAESNLIVQTTTLGMAGTESPDWPIDACSADTIVVDVVYRPLETPLLAAARARGLKTVDGLGMLIHQGARSFEIWFGIKPDVAKARARLEAALA
jgi:shikimate dehydrogenase